MPPWSLFLGVRGEPRLDLVNAYLSPLAPSHSPLPVCQCRRAQLDRPDCAAVQKLRLTPLSPKRRVGRRLSRHIATSCPGNERLTSSAALQTRFAPWRLVALPHCLRLAASERLGY